MADKKVVMTAKEMFERLDFKQTEILDNGKTIIYLRNDGGYKTEYAFINHFKRLKISEWEEYNDNKPQGNTTQHVETHIAIHQQMKELGWL